MIFYLLRNIKKNEKEAVLGLTIKKPFWTFLKCPIWKRGLPKLRKL
jgi:hypothetical protein